MTLACHITTTTTTTPTTTTTYLTADGLSPGSSGYYALILLFIYLLPHSIDPS
jgi:hypothetical protein